MITLLPVSYRMQLTLYERQLKRMTDPSQGNFTKYLITQKLLDGFSPNFLWSIYIYMGSCVLSFKSIGQWEGPEIAGRKGPRPGILLRVIILGSPWHSVPLKSQECFPQSTPEDRGSQGKSLSAWANWMGWGQGVKTSPLQGPAADVNLYPTSELAT